MDDQTPEEARDRAAHISGVSYNVSITVSDDPASLTFQNETTIRFRSTSSSSWIDFSGQSVDFLQINGRKISSPTVMDGRLPLMDLSSENEIQLRVTIPYRNTGVGMHRHVDPKDKRVYLYTNCEPFNAHLWLPCFDQPDLKAPLSLSVSAPSSWKVIANSPAIAGGTGKVGSGQPESAGAASGITTIRFQPTPPISTYLMAMCAGPFAELRNTTRSGIDCGIYVRQSLLPFLDEQFFFDTTERGLDFYHRLFDMPYPFAKYDQVLVPEFNSGAMENPGCITLRDQACVFLGKPTQSDYALVAEFILHEMAHMWFGDLVTLSGWEDLWLNESFADLMEKLSQDELMPDTHVWADFANGRKAWGLAADQLPSTHPVAPAPVPVSRTRDNFDGITYAKGGASLYQLIAHTGKDEFIQGVRKYLNTHAWSNATLADFLSCIEEASGKELGDWADLWLRTKGVSQISAEPTIGKDGTWQQVLVSQRPACGDQVLRPHTLRLGAYSRDSRGKLVRTGQTIVTLDKEQERVTVPGLAGREPAPLLLVNDDDLSYAKVRLDNASVCTLLAEISAIEDPLARSLCWGIMWDMTRDAEMAVTAFVRLVAEHAPFETQTTVLSSLLSKASYALEMYAQGAERIAARRTLIDAARNQMMHAKRGSDAQLVWGRTFISIATSASDIRLIKGLLDGSRSVSGLTVDTNLRWNIVEALSRRGQINDAVISAHGSRDGTDIGRRRALTALASLPTSTAKTDAWKKLTATDGVSLQDKLAVASGFVQFGQDHLLSNYLPRYVELLPPLWKDFSPEEARSLTSALYPLPLVSPRTLKAVAPLLDTPLPESAKRSLLDSMDATTRALRARRKRTAPDSLPLP